MQYHAILAAFATGAFPIILGLLALVIALVALSKVSALRDEWSKSVPAAPARAASQPVANTAPAHDDAISPEIIAAIAAAVACFTGPSHRVVSIKRQSTSWEKAGRQSVLTSHRIR